MRKTNKALALFIATVMVLSLFSFLTLTGSADEPALVNVALNTTATASENLDSFPRPIAQHMFLGNQAIHRLLNGNTTVTDMNQRITWGTNGSQQNAFNAAYRQMLGNPEADWFATPYRPHLWFGVDFGVPTEFSQIVIYETAQAGAVRGFMGTFVIEVANNIDLSGQWVPPRSGANTNSHIDSFNTVGWTQVGGIFTANDPADFTWTAGTAGFAGGPTTIDLPADFTGAYRFVRVRTIQNIMPPTNAAGVPLAELPGIGLPNITALIVNGPAGQTFTPVDEDVAVTLGTTSAIVGQGLQLPLLAAPAEATLRDVVWSIDAASTAPGASISEDGLLTAEGVGQVMLRATVYNGLVGANWTETFTINFINIGAPPSSLVVDEPVNLPMTVTPEDAVDGDVVWSVVEGSLTTATYTLVNNVLTATGTGTLRVRATVESAVEDAPPFVAEWTITVVATRVAVTGITIPAAQQTATVGVAAALTPIIAPADNTSTGVSWALGTGSTAPGAAVTPAGVVTTTGVGTVVVIPTALGGAADGTDFVGEPITITFGLPMATDVTDVPTTGEVGTALTLTGTVVPADAGEITWTVYNAGTTGATITGNVLNATAAGTVVVRATVGNVHFNREITITGGADDFVAVTGITVANRTFAANANLTLAGVVAPTNATNSTITWSIVTGAGTTAAGAQLNGAVLTATGAGAIRVLATVTNGATATTAFTQEFDITVTAAGTGTAFVPVTGITGVPTSLTESTTLTLTGTVAPTNATNSTIVWTVVSGPATITGNVLTPTGVGVVRVRATIANGTAAGTNFTDEFYVTVNKSEGSPKMGEPIIVAVGALAMVAAIGGYAVMMKKKDSANV